MPFHTLLRFPMTPLRDKARQVISSRTTTLLPMLHLPLETTFRPWNPVSTRIVGYATSVRRTKSIQLGRINSIGAISRNVQCAKGHGPHQIHDAHEDTNVLIHPVRPSTISARQSITGPRSALHAEHVSTQTRAKPVPTVPSRGEVFRRTFAQIYPVLRFSTQKQ